MSSLVYLDRLRQRLPPVAKGMRCTVHRILLAALILAAKNLNDSSPKNKHWARYSCVRGYDGFGFSLTEVNLMEKQLLFLLDWDMRITQEDLLTHLEPFLSPIRVQLQRRVEEDEMARRIQLREREIIRQHHRDLPSDHRVRDEPVRLDVPLSDSPTTINSSYPTKDLLRPTLGNSTFSSHQLGSKKSQHLLSIPSFSPPSSLDVPGLTRSGTMETTSSSRSSSSTGTPVSSVGSYIDLDEDAVQVVSMGASPGMVTHLHQSSQAAMKVHLLSVERFDEGKPPKKLKTGGNFISRFLGVGAAERYERLNLRTRSQPQPQYA